MNPVMSRKGLSLFYITEEEFAASRTEWNGLLEKSATNEIFLSWEWMYSWWHVFKDKKKSIFILVGIDDDGHWVGIAPLYIEQRSIPGLYKKRILRLCSSVEVYPEHLDFICIESLTKEFPERVFAYLQERSTEWDRIELTSIKEVAIVKSYLLSTSNSKSNFIISSQAQQECPYLKIETTFQDYLKSFSGKTRNTLARKRKRILEKEQWVFHVLESQSEDYTTYLRELFSLHAGRSLRNKTSTKFRGDKIYGFHEKLIGYLYKNGNIIITTLQKESAIQVIYYCLSYNKKYLYYQTGISRLGEQKSAGTVLLSMTLEMSFKEGCTEFDFLRGKEKYKYFWTRDARTSYALSIRKKTLSNWIAAQFSRYLFRPGTKSLNSLAKKSISQIAKINDQWRKAGRDLLFAWHREG
jgi:CelD/BcsL family acetyltransferase involved in cellulose biosynthesis